MRAALIASFVVLASFVSLVVGSGEALAQTCRGLVDVSSSARGIAGTNVTFNSSVATYSGFVGGGSDTLFGGGSVGVFHYDDLGITTWGVGGLFGGQVAADAERKVVICPNGFVETEFANDILGSGVVPHIGFAVARVRTEFSGFGESETLTDTVGAVRLGVGLILNQRTSVTPYVSVPHRRRGWRHVVRLCRVVQLRAAVGSAGALRPAGCLRAGRAS
jgi:hypothetical protein